MAAYGDAKRRFMSAIHAHMGSGRLMSLKNWLVLLQAE
jgi:hypothetical protein